MKKRPPLSACGGCKKQCISYFFGDISAAERVSMLMTTQNEWFAGADPRELNPLALSNRMFNLQQIIELLLQLEKCYPPVIRTA